METRKYSIVKNNDYVFNNNVDYCIGTGRMGLALQKEYYEQLKLVQEEIGFSHIRGHGLFSDDMAIYQEYTDQDGNIKGEYNFTYLDLVMDSYLSLNIKPFLELGFMPGKMASGSQTIFYWKGNVTPPKSYDAWKELVQATLRHLLERYGDRVLEWPIEVWNEPNLPGFWKDAHMEEYFRLFEVSFKGIKEVNPNFKVGGPAICGVDDERWLNEFLKFCTKNSLKIDFITRHHYTSEPPERGGHYSYVELVPIDECMDSLNTSRNIIDSFGEYRGMDMHITEFNTSYVPNAPVHDTNYNAAYVAHMLSVMGNSSASYSYWTFGDIFEEFGVPFTPFHGGFGLVANGKIPKPTFWTFKFFKMLKGECVHKSGDSVVVTKGGGYNGVAWNTSKESIGLEFALPENAVGEYSITGRTVDEDVCNPLKLWHDIGEPAHLSPEQLSLIREAARPLISSRTIDSAKEKTFTVKLKPNAVVYFEIMPVKPISDRGYDYWRIMGK